VFHITDEAIDDPVKRYDAIVSLVDAVTSGERDLIANLANAASVLFHMLPDVNWAGFYLLRDSELVLGPFHGKPAGVRIAMGRGVCGTSAQQKQTLVVPNVHQFPGHIACDAASASEIVVPMIVADRLIGVLDIDSPVAGRFSDVDRLHLESIVELLMSRCR
jgi:GAF domain-containing protein